jgi:hypothetical protein
LFSKVLIQRSWVSKENLLSKVLLPQCCAGDFAAPLGQVGHERP